MNLAADQTYIALTPQLRACITNAKAADARFRNDFRAWAEQDGDDIPPPDMMCAALELSAHLAAILDQLGGEQR